MRGRVVVCKEHNQPFVIEEYTVPEIEPGAILLRMVQSGICGSDLHYWRGDQAKAPAQAPEPAGSAASKQRTSDDRSRG